jgi:iron complex outermembrane receptor protein
MRVRSPSFHGLTPAATREFAAAGVVIVKTTLVSIVVALCASVLPAAAQAVSQRYQLDIPRQSLDGALRQFAEQTGLQVAHFSDAPEGRVDVGPITGEFSALQALDSLLSPHGLGYRVINDRTVAVASRQGEGTGSSEATQPAQAEPQLSEVTVTATRKQLYTPRVVTSGVLGDKDAIDIPFSISSYTGELAKLQGALTPVEILKNDPSAQNPGNFIGYQNNVVIRGFASAQGGVRRDGLIANHEGDFPIEAYDRIEVVKGVAGFLYGFAEPGGILNFVTKRPTSEAFASVELQFREQPGDYVHLDAGGPIADGRYGYRVNVVHQDQGDFTHPADVRRWAAALAFDAHLTESLLLRFEANYQDREQPSTFGLPLTVDGEEPPQYDPDTLLVAPWARSGWTSSHAGVLADYALGDVWKIQAQVGVDELTTRLNFGMITALEPDGDFEQLLFTANPRSSARYDELTAQLLALGDFDTGPLRHELAIGAFRREQDYEFYYPTGNGATVVAGNIHDVSYPGRPAGDFGPLFLLEGYDTTETHLFVGDTIHMGERWRMLLGARHVDVSDTPYYDAVSEVSPSGALLFKPGANATLYGSYARSLQYGTRAPCLGEDITNLCELLPPIEAKQVELGAKARLASALDLGLAFYRIELPSDYIDPAQRLYGRFGEQVNRGVELTATGNIRPNLAVVAGLGYLDAERTRNADPSLNGNRVEALSRLTGNLFVNYGVESVPGLSLNAGIYRAGSRVLDLRNRIPVSGYTRADIGAQYRLRAFAKDVVIRANVNNVFDKFYWEGLGPFAHSYTPGRGRTYLLSARMELL